MNNECSCAKLAAPCIQFLEKFKCFGPGRATKKVGGLFLHMVSQARRKLIECSTFDNSADMKRAFNSVDKVGDYFVFNIGGNRCRLIAAIHFNTQTLYVRSVLTHAEYDHWRP